MYWSALGIGEEPRIFCFDLTSKTSRKLVAMGIPAGVPTMTVDAHNDKIYWSETDDEGIEIVKRANLDGSQIEVVFEAIAIGSLFVDGENSAVYWSAPDLGIGEEPGIFCFDLTSKTSRQIIATGIPTMTVDTHNDKIYFRFTRPNQR